MHKAYREQADSKTAVSRGSVAGVGGEAHGLHLRVSCPVRVPSGVAQDQAGNLDQLFFFNVYLLQREKERDRERGREEEGERDDLKQASSSEQSLMQGSIPKPKSRVRCSVHPGAPRLLQSKSWTVGGIGLNSVSLEFTSRDSECDLLGKSVFANVIRVK